MDKGFQEIFPSLQLDKDLVHALEGAVVTKVSANRDRTAMRIYLHLQALIPKRRIWKLEQEIKKQCFPRENVRIHIIESFSLSSLYTPEKLYDAYKDSIFEEIDAFSSLLLGIYKKADIVFSGDNHITCLLYTSPSPRD